MSYKIQDRTRVALGGQANNRTLSQITHIAWHYTGTTNSFITNHERYWRNSRGWRRGGYHFYIARDGKIYQNYNYRTISNGVRNHNSYIINISVEASTANNYTATQEKARDWLTRIIMGDLNIPGRNVLGHKEFPGQSTSCPGYSVARMNQFRKNLSNGKPVKPTTPNMVKPTTGKLDVDGYWGANTTRALQKALGTPVDGILSRPSMVIRELQKLVGAKVDGYRGPETYKKLQAYLGTPVDGKLSTPSLMVKEMQRKLNAGTFKKGTKPKPAPKPSKPAKKSNATIAKEVMAGKWGDNPKRKQDLIKAGYNYNAIQAEVNRLAGGTSKPSKPKPKPSKSSKPKASLAVDGKWGKGTTRALQKALGTPVDGIISRQPRNKVSRSLYGGTVHFGSGGSMVIRALQRKINVKVDGKLGPATARALQKYLGTVQDGVLSRPSLVIKELQRKLNSGTF